MRPPTLSRQASFRLLAAVMLALMFAASAPTPLYVVYESRWDFSAIVLTAVFAVYALALLIALLTTGRLSDYLGRRPVLAAGLVVQVAAMAAFLLAQGVAMLFVARTLQGVGTGIATAALSAWLLDLEPPERPGLGGLVAAVAPLTGLALGALTCGFLVQYGPDPLRLVFWLLIAAFLLALSLLPAIADVSVRRPSWRDAIKPEVGIPPAARPLFVASAPALAATWALGGLYLSLGPSLAIHLLGSESHVAGGLVVVALAGTGALASALARSVEPRLLVARASLALLVGVAITLVAVASGSTALLYLGSVVAGAGFGTAFSGVFRSLAPLAPPDGRSALVASMYVVCYLAFSIPAVVAGVALTHYDLADTTYVYGAVLIALAAVTAWAVGRGLVREAG